MIKIAVTSLLTGPFYCDKTMYMSRIVFFGMLLYASHGYATPKEPTVTSAIQKKTEGCADDPLSPCITETVTILNPLFVPVIVTLECGINDRQVVQVAPRTRFSVSIELTEPAGRMPACLMVTWKRFS